MDELRLTMKRVSGKYIVKRIGYDRDHVFDNVTDALNFITLTKYINLRIGRMR